MSEKNKKASTAFEQSEQGAASPITEAVPNLYQRRSDKPARIIKSAESQEHLEQSQQEDNFKKPKVLKPLQVLKSATNATGVVFNPGDLILVTPPWGGKATAEIVSFYSDDGGSVWAQYIPKSSRPDWPWDKGLVRALLLTKA